MGGFALLSSFACDTCGSPAIMLPDAPEDASMIRCSGCGSRLGSWGEFKARARQLIVDDPSHAHADPKRVSVDLALDP